jgi:hypothetical protein
MYHIFFIQPLVAWYLGWFHNPANISSAVINMGFQVSLLYVDLYSIGYMSKSRDFELKKFSVDI